MASRTHYLEVCAQRMERTLNSKPRKMKTAEYVKTMPKRGPVKVSAEEYLRAREIGRAVVAAAAAKTTMPIDDTAPTYAAPAIRKDRMRARSANPKGVHLIVLMRAQKRRCASCGGLMFNASTPCETGLNATLDHVIPRSRGGSNALGNFLAMHSRCNNKKADRAPNGCERILLLAVNAQLGVEPTR